MVRDNLEIIQTEEVFSGPRERDDKLRKWRRKDVEWGLLCGKSLFLPRVGQSRLECFEKVRGIEGFI